MTTEAFVELILEGRMPVKRLPRTDLKPGMVTAQDILSYDLKTIVPKGVILTENIISRLEEFSIYYVSIDETIDHSIFQHLSVPMVNQLTFQSNNSTMDAFHAANKTNLQAFLHDFSKCTQHYQDHMMDTLYRNEPLHTQELLTEALSLFEQYQSCTYIFDILFAVHAMDTSVYSHCLRVALIAYTLSRWLHFSDADQSMAAACGLFHDIGKLLLPFKILQKPGKFTSEELEIIKTHTTEGFHLLNKSNHVPVSVKNTALMHHEKCDGSGYPYGLLNEEIDTFSKLITIADHFDTMSTMPQMRTTLCPFSVIKQFEDDGIPKYELPYILTFLEHMANAYSLNKITLTYGLEGNIVLLNCGDYPTHTSLSENVSAPNPQELYYNSMLKLSEKENLSMETILS